MDDLLAHYGDRAMGPVLSEKIGRIKALRSRPVGPLWHCGHHHAERGEAIECKRRQAGAFC